MLLNSIFRMNVEKPLLMFQKIKIIGYRMLIFWRLKGIEQQK